METPLRTVALSAILMNDSVQTIAASKLDVDDDAMVEMRRAAELTTVSSYILDEVVDALASTIANNLNGMMKVMTALLIVIAVPYDGGSAAESRSAWEMARKTAARCRRSEHEVAEIPRSLDSGRAVGGTPTAAAR